LRKEGDRVVVAGEDFSVAMPKERTAVYENHVGKSVIFGIRPENIHNPEFIPPNTKTELAPAKVDVTELMGNEIFLHLLSGDVSFVARVDPRSEYNVGDAIQVAFDMDSVHIFDAETEEAIR
jgi:multiple sugar transport system ATP-binding protein